MQKIFTCDGINPKTKQLYKSCPTCRARNANWKHVIFGKNSNDTAAADNASSSETESNATEQTIPPEVDAVTIPHQVEVVQVTMSRETETADDIESKDKQYTKRKDRYI
jgi:hypothetical protein